ncbi:MAG: ubiquinone/menaquinone biosynthesis methyltransferase [Deltaproteobacteria bacterium]
MPETKSLFNRVAKNYDRLNSLFSLGIDKSWRRRLIREIGADGGNLLDIATGTAEVAIEYLRRNPRSVATGIDPSEAMLEIAGRKLDSFGMRERMRLILGVAEGLPFEGGSFDAVTIAFGIRNTVDPLASLREMRRALTSGGKVGILEFAVPNTPVLSPAYMFYLKNVMPLIGSIFGTREEYDYLAESIPKFPQREAFIALMREAGLRDCKSVELTLGTVIIYTGVK